MELNNDQIRALLPHRHPFLLIDRITDCEPGQWAKGRKCVSAGEPCFQGHFPEKSIFPGVLTIEALAQTGAIALLCQEENRGKLILFGGIRHARFRRPVTPGDVLELECRIISRRGPLGIGEAVARVDGVTVCDAELTFALTEG